MRAYRHRDVEWLGPDSKQVARSAWRRGLQTEPDVHPAEMREIWCDLPCCVPDPAGESPE